MERTMSVEDRIRRAEERYYKKSVKVEIPPKDRSSREESSKKQYKLFKKMTREIVVCLIIYGIFYTITNSNYIFSEDFTNKAKEVLNKDINFIDIYTNAKDGITSFVQNLNSEQKDNQQNNNDEQSIEENKQSEENQTNNEKINLDNIQNNDENIGGAADEINSDILWENIENSENISDGNNQENSQTEENKEETQLSQMEMDANSVKEAVSFIKPVEGTISSKFGPRNPTTASVPKNHTGTDIAAVTGTKIISATDGVVTLNSSQGDYGKHLIIQIGDIVVLYAHCSKLYVNEGDEIKQGQEIAEVGSTGNTTGPHLHFEVRYQGRYVDPQMILEL